MLEFEMTRARTRAIAAVAIPLREAPACSGTQNLDNHVSLRIARTRIDCARLKELRQRPV